LARVQALAASRGGVCLSNVYAGIKQPLEWRCAHGHEWSAPLGNVLHGKTWCRFCAIGAKKNTIEQMRTCAESRGGLCLSDKYINGTTYLKWRCALGHEWDSTPTTIVTNGSWCGACADIARRRKIDDLREHARSLGGECLAETYADSAAHVDWICARGHKWAATSADVLGKGTWCKQCFHIDRRGTIEEMQTFAATRGGRCLSEAYIQSGAHLEWQCDKGHRWIATPNGILMGGWCPDCKHKGEAIARECMQGLTGKPFKKCRPAWLRGAAGNLLELDGYCKELGLAFEYHGVQHFEFVPHFHRDGEALARQRRRDEEKRSLCVRNGVLLLEIPAPTKTTPEAIQAAVRAACQSQCIPIFGDWNV
jgi:hypothetical protein